MELYIKVELPYLKEEAGEGGINLPIWLILLFLFFL